jgi:hypothetical protein
MLKQCKWWAAGTLAAAMLALPAAASAWTLRVDGAGPLKIGMRFDTVNKILGEHLQRVPKDERAHANCFQIEPPVHPGVLLMFVDDHLQRIDVVEEGIASDRGIALGDGVDKVKRSYGEALRAETKYLTVRTGGDQYAIRFETSDGKVDAMYAGAWKEVQWAEGCQ